MTQQDNLSRSSREYSMIDVMKLFFAVSIIHFHVPKNNTFGYLWGQYLGRLGVPFFMAVTGFFLYGRVEKQNGYKPFALVGYQKRILKLILIWTLIYSPILLYRVYTRGLAWSIQQYLFKTPAYLWYLTALLIGCFIYCGFAYNIKLYFAVAIALYMIGASGNTYVDIFGLRDVWTPYWNVFLTTRNGVFLAPVFLGLGGLIAHFRIDKRRLSHWWIGGGYLRSYRLYFWC